MQGVRSQAIHPALRLLLDLHLVEGNVLALGCGAAAIELGHRGHEVWSVDAPGAAAGPHTPSDPLGLDALDRSFHTVIDLDWLRRLPGKQRPAYARQLADLVLPSGFLHVLAPSGSPPASISTVLNLFRPGWTLLAVHDSRDLQLQCGGLASFLRTPKSRRPERPAVRSFSDLRAFGSLDWGGTNNRPPGI